MFTLQSFAAVCGLAVSAAALGQTLPTATLHNGTVVTQKVPLELYAVEGTVWDIDIPARTITAVGRTIHVPASLNGGRFFIENTEVVNEFGISLGSISTANFDRLSDVNASTRDAIVLPACPECGPVRLGAQRSLFSTTEARSNPVGTLDRFPSTETAIEDNYFRLAINLFNRYTGVLPVSFLGRIGVRNAQGQYPTSPFQLPPRTHWRYPHTSGSVIRSEGSVYVDSAGNEYLIPDSSRPGRILHISQAEHFTLGPCRAVRRGNLVTPDSLLVGDLLITPSQDPRFPVIFRGLGGTEVSRDVFFRALRPGDEVSVVGSLVGDHVLFGNEFDAPNLYDPAMGVAISAVSFFARASTGDLRWRGEISPIEGLTVTAMVGAGAELPVTVIVDPLTGIGSYTMRLTGIAMPENHTVTMIVRDANGVEQARQIFDFAAFIQ
jgi:hypothetical protein